MKKKDQHTILRTVNELLLGALFIVGLLCLIIKNICVGISWLIIPEIIILAIVFYCSLSLYKNFEEYLDEIE